MWLWINGGSLSSSDLRADTKACRWLAAVGRLGTTTKQPTTGFTPIADAPMAHALSAVVAAG